jgi:hypothetical protein
MVTPSRVGYEYLEDVKNIHRRTALFGSTTPVPLYLL